MLLAALGAALACEVPEGALNVVAASKVDLSGRFRPFPGVTVIAAVGDRNQIVFDRVFQLLSRSSQVTQHCALLPAQSYHMTTHNLFVESDVGKGKLRTFTRENFSFFQGLNRQLQENQFRPIISIQGVTAGQTLGLRVQLAPEQAQIVGSIAQAFGIQGKVPAPFHITLCYFFDDSSATMRKELASALESSLFDLLENQLQSLTLDPPRLSYFYDMTAFYPWDLNTTPF